MLSAIAARKARLQQHRKEAVVERDSSSSVPPENGKRKSSGAAQRSTKKRRKEEEESSDDGDNEDEKMVIAIEDDDEHVGDVVLAVTANDGALLSTFTPIPGQTVLPNTPASIHALGLSPTSSPPGSAFLCLVPGASLALLGVCTLTPLRGHMSLAGTSLLPNTAVNVFAPRTHGLPVLCANANAKEDAVVLVNRLDTGIEGLELVCGIAKGVFSPPPRAEAANFGVEGVCMVIRGMRTLEIPDAWADALMLTLPSTLDDDDETTISVPTDNPVYLIRGPKRTGKSTLARTLFNTLLNTYRRVAFLETDLGQSELGPPGLVTLHVLARPLFGAPFTHPAPAAAYRAHFVGATTPKGAPAFYVGAVADLAEVYRREVQFPSEDVDVEEAGEGDARVGDVVPLVVNTMGWAKGLGADLVRRIEEVVQPAHVFVLSADEGVPAIQNGTQEQGPRIHVLPAAAPPELVNAHSAADARTLALMSYFHASLDRGSPTWSHTPLCALPPYELTAHTALDALVLLAPGGEDVVPREVHRVLPGAIVGLIAPDEDSPRTEDDASKYAESNGLPYVQGAPPPDPRSSTCLGLALVRGVSVSGEVDIRHGGMRLQLLTPVPPAVLVRVRVLAVGAVEAPVWAWVDVRSGVPIVPGDGEKDGVREDVPYLRWGRAEGLGAERKRVRRNLMRRGQL